MKNLCPSDEDEEGACSHLCLLTPGSYQCACPDYSKFINDAKTQCDAGTVNSIFISPSPGEICLPGFKFVQFQYRLYITYENVFSPLF